MKKKVQLLCVLVLLIFMGVWIFLDRGKEVVFRLDENGAPVLWIKCDTGIIELNAWIDEVSENTYFFFRLLLMMILFTLEFCQGTS